MKTNSKIFKGTIIFAFIGFITYLLIILASFLGCCTGITSSGFHIVLIILIVAGLGTFGICFYNNCYKGSKDKV